MRGGIIIACLCGLLATTPLFAQNNVYAGDNPSFRPIVDFADAPASSASATKEVEAAPDQGLTWHPPWGLVDLTAIPDGRRVAPNGFEYHPNFSIDVDVNFWLWRSHGLYLFLDGKLWGEKGEYDVTNVNDGVFATSKREFDFSGGVAWNYCGAFEARAFGYSNNNLNRGLGEVAPLGFTDGFGIENRYYLAKEYEKLGEPGFDVTKASFLSIGYYPSKVMVGNNGEKFDPGLMLRAYVTQDLWNWPAYLYGDVTYIGERSVRPKLLLLDSGIAARPIPGMPQWELRVGVESTADVEDRNADTSCYGSIRFIF